MRPISLVLAISLQPKTLIQILSGAKDSPMASHYNDLHSIIDTRESKEVLNLIGHDIRKGIVVLRSVQRQDQHWSWRRRRGRVMGYLDLLVWNVDVRRWELRWDWLAVRHDGSRYSGYQTDTPTNVSRT